MSDTAVIDARLDSVYVCSIADDRIKAIRVVRNPDKLTYISRQLSTMEMRQLD